MSTCQNNGNHDNSWANNLTNSQKDVIKQIVQYGTDNGFNVHIISAAIDFAFIESSFGLQLSNGIPGNTATGLFAYTDGNWSTHHASIGIKDDFANQIEAIFDDISLYHEWFYNPRTSGNIPKDEMTFWEYAYVKHHDGRSFDDFDNAPGEDKYNAAVGPLGYEIKRAEALAYESLGLCKEEYRRGDGKPVYEFSNQSGEGGSELDPSEPYFIESWEPDREHWSGTLTHDGEEYDFSFYGTEYELDYWLDNEEYMDLIDDEEEFSEEEPLVIDLDGDGIELISIEESDATFDFNMDGEKVKTSWISSDDGILVLDRNQNDNIENVSEWFGSFGLNGELGFDQLTKLDENQDGRISSEDSIFSELKVWRDLDGNGESNSDELFTLEELGIESIGINLATPEIIEGIGPEGEVGREAQVSFSDGSSSIVGEVWLAAETNSEIQLIEAFGPSMLEGNLPETNLNEFDFHSYQEA